MRAAIIALLFVPLLSGLSAAHEPDTFTVIVREDTHSPQEVNLVVNDTVQYYNVDSRENMTHKIGLDLNGDGDFNDTGEFSSGTLHSECDWDNDSDCRVAWIFIINDTSLVGNYILSDLLSDGTEIEVRLNISADVHTIEAPAIGECFGDCVDEDSDEEMKRSSQTDLQKGLMLVGMTMFGGASVILLSALMQKL
tara:strand:+ start:1280 stop:1864 length:585 start_codon:yes stop_codon:yes gene_type:complete